MQYFLATGCLAPPDLTAHAPGRIPPGFGHLPYHTRSQQAPGRANSEPRVMPICVSRYPCWLRTRSEPARYDPETSVAVIEEIREPDEWGGEPPGAPKAAVRRRAVRRNVGRSSPLAALAVAPGAWRANRNLHWANSIDD